MEKFGIFELLDTLSALVTGQEGKVGENPEQAPRQEAPSSAFAPPDYFASEPTPQSEKSEQTAQETGGENSALSSLLSRHEQVKRKAEKRNR